MPVAVPLMAMRRPSPQLRRTIVRGVPASALAWLWPARLCSTWVLCVEGELRFGARNGFGMIRREVRSLSQWSRVRRRSWHESPTPVPWRDRPSDGRCIARSIAWARGRMVNRHSCLVLWVVEPQDGDSPSRSEGGVEELEAHHVARTARLA